jgi:hypothetical protein
MNEDFGQVAVDGGTAEVVPPRGHAMSIGNGGFVEVRQNE